MYEIAMTSDTEIRSELTTEVEQRWQQEFDEKYGGELIKLIKELTEE